MNHGWKRFGPLETNLRTIYYVDEDWVLPNLEYGKLGKGISKRILISSLSRQKVMSAERGKSRPMGGIELGTLQIGEEITLESEKKRKWENCQLNGSFPEVRLLLLHLLFEAWTTPF